jgi:hypothetical protein
MSTPSTLAYPRAPAGPFFLAPATKTTNSLIGLNIRAEYGAGASAHRRHMDPCIKHAYSCMVYAVYPSRACTMQHGAHMHAGSPRASSARTPTLPAHRRACSSVHHRRRGQQRLPHGLHADRRLDGVPECSSRHGSDLEWARHERWQPKALLFAIIPTGCLCLLHRAPDR